MAREVFSRCPACVWIAIFLLPSFAGPYGPAPVSVSVGGPAVISEGDASYFTINKPPIVSVRVRMEMQGTAAYGFDYTPSRSVGEIVIPTGESKANITVQTHRDVLSEETETISLRILPNPPFYYIAGPEEASIQVLDRDPLEVGKSPPIISLGALPQLVSTRSNVVLTATANDPDSDHLLIQFHLDDQTGLESATWRTNSQSVSVTASNLMPGVKNVYVTALDQEGGFTFSSTSQVVVAREILSPQLFGAVNSSQVREGESVATANAFNRVVVEWDVPVWATNSKAFARFTGTATGWVQAYAFAGGPTLSTNISDVEGEFITALDRSSTKVFEIDISRWSQQMAGRRLGLILRPALGEVYASYWEFQLVIVTPESKSSPPTIKLAGKGNTMTAVEGGVINVPFIIEAPDAVITQCFWTSDDRSEYPVGSSNFSAGTNILEIVQKNLRVGVQGLRAIIKSGQQRFASERFTYVVSPIQGSVSLGTPVISGDQLTMKILPMTYFSPSLETSSDLVHWVTSFYVPQGATNVTLTNQAGSLFFRLKYFH
jgi:hypothetical protein